jgi:hypothetical protein
LNVPWTAITAVRETIFTQGGGVVLVQVDRKSLTGWHVLYSLLYGGGFRRGVLFTSLLPGFEELRQRLQAAATRRHEDAPQIGGEPIYVEGGRAEHLAMVRDPVMTLYRAGEYEEPEEEQEQKGPLLKKGMTYTPRLSDLPWETSRDEDEATPVDEKVKAERSKRRGTIRAMVTLALIPLFLIVIETILFPNLSRPLAWIALRPGSGRLGGVLSGILMALFLTLETPFGAGLLTTVADMHDQDEKFQRVFSWYPLVVSPKILVAVGLFFLGSTGMIQPLFTFWWGLGLIWSSIILWLVCRDLYGWEAVGITIVLSAHTLFQALAMLIYLIFR